MTCSTCGRENPSHLTFCQECGQRLGPRIAPPTPPIGLGANGSEEAFQNAPARASTALGGVGAPRALATPESAGDRRCKVCNTPNGPNLRYCTSCGSTLEPRPNLAAAPSPAAVGSTPPSPAHPGSSPAGRECSRCKGHVDATAQFCKFCGNSLAVGGPSGVTPLAVHERLDSSAANGVVSPHGGKAPIVAAGAPLAAPANHAGSPLPLPATHAPRPSPSPIGPSAGFGPSAVGGGHAAAEERSSNHGPPPGSGAAALAAVAVRPSAGASPAAAARAPSPTARGRLVVIAKSGADGPSYPFGDLLDVGREEGDVVVNEDPYLSPRHVRIQWNAGKLLLRDLGSTNGVYLRLAALRDTNPRKRDAEIAVPLEDQDFILVGQQVLRFDVLKEAEGGFGPAQEHGTLLFGSPAAPRYARLCQRTVEGISRDVYYVRKVETVLGRESGDVVFTEDPFLSRRHAAIRLLSREASPPGAASRPPPGEPRFALVDLGSSNGTFLRVRGDVELASGDHFRVGQQLFRVDFDGGRG